MSQRRIYCYDCPCCGPVSDRALLLGEIDAQTCETCGAALKQNLGRKFRDGGAQIVTPLMFCHATYSDQLPDRIKGLGPSNPERQRYFREM